MTSTARHPGELLQEEHVHLTKPSRAEQSLKTVMAIPNLSFLAAAVAVVTAATFSGVADATTYLTLHNLCPFPVWPLITPNTGLPPLYDAPPRLDAAGAGLITLPFPDASWAGRVVARTGCASSSPAATCATGAAPPFTVAQLSVHAPGDAAGYSVSLVDGYNVPMAISPQGDLKGQCPVLGCAVDLNARCPLKNRVYGAGGAVVACRSAPNVFKAACPNTRTTSSDSEDRPQSCVAPGELKIIFCPGSVVQLPENGVVGRVAAA